MSISTLWRASPVAERHTRSERGLSSLRPSAPRGIRLLELEVVLAVFCSIHQGTHKQRSMVSAWLLHVHSPALHYKSWHLDKNRLGLSTSSIVPVATCHVVVPSVRSSSSPSSSTISVSSDGSGSCTPNISHHTTSPHIRTPKTHQPCNPTTPSPPKPHPTTTPPPNRSKIQIARTWFLGSSGSLAS